MKYKLNVGLNYPTSEKVDQELLAMASLPEEERQAGVMRIAKEGGFICAEAGTVVDNLPASSIPWLLEQQLIEAVEETPRSGRVPKDKPVVIPEGE